MLLELATMNSQPCDLNALIDEYLICAENALERMRAHFGVNHLLGAWRRGEIPSAGKITEDCRFMFHGFGCKFNMGTTIVDVEIGMQGQVAGFEPSQLLRFAGPRLQMTYAQLQEELERMVREGTVQRSNATWKSLYQKVPA